MEAVTRLALNKQDRLRLFLRQKKIKQIAMAKKLGISENYMSKILFDEFAPPHWIEAMVSQLELPQELLPIPRYIKSGPKPKVKL